MNPGYYGDRRSIVRDCTGITRQVVGYFHAAHGHERDFARVADQLAAEIALEADPVGFRSFVNLGLPEWWCLVLQRDDASAEHLPTELSQLCSLPPTIDVGDLVMRFDRPEATS